MARPIPRLVGGSPRWSRLLAPSSARDGAGESQAKSSARSVIDNRRDIGDALNARIELFAP
jgi:hypothetical protein